MSLPGKADEDAQGDRKRRFEEIIAGERDALYRTALTLTRKRQDAEDVLQETLARAWRSLDSFRQGAPPRGWLTTILVNVYRDRYRKQKRSVQTTSLEGDDLHVYAGAVDTGTSGAENPENSVLTEEISGPVLRAIQDLPTPFREALLLVDLEGFTYREAAEILGTLTGTVMSRLHRARKRLGRELAPYVAAESPRQATRPRKRPGPEQALARRRVIHCGEACRHLHSYVDGVLDKEDAHKIDEHLVTCRRCCDRYEFERRQKALLVTHHLGTTVPRTLMQRWQSLIARF